VNPHVRFEEEADAEYRVAGRWYEDHRQHLGVESFDAVDATIDRIVMLPDAGSPVPRMPADCRCDDVRFRASRITSCTFRSTARVESSPLLTTGEDPGTGKSA
jgi:hypothetical protein